MGPQAFNAICEHIGQQRILNLVSELCGGKRLELICYFRVFFANAVKVTYLKISKQKRENVKTF